MKKIILASALAILTIGCSSPKAPTQTINFSGVNDKEYNAILISNDGFQTATFKDCQGHEYKLKNATTASGTRLINEKGVQIHFKRGEGILNLEKNSKDIFLKYKQ